MEQTSTVKTMFSWGIFILIVGLIIWGLVVAQKKADREEAQLVLPNQITETDHVRGSDTAPITLVEYGDFQCPACAAFHPLVDRLITDMGPEQIRIIFRHFPLAQHGNAVPASRAAEAAGIQGKFWEMSTIIYERQGAWEKAPDAKNIFVSYAEELGLDTTKFTKDLDLKSVIEKVDTDYKGGVKAGVNSTPTFFVNGKQIKSSLNYDEFKKIITETAQSSTTQTQ